MIVIVDKRKKEITLQKWIRKVKHVNDEWGGIDGKIQEAVAMLNALGIPTTGSCEGHINHGSPAPWIKITASYAPKRKKWLYKRVSELLNQFYTRRDVPPDVRLVLEDAHAGFWIHNGGNAYQRWRDTVNKTAKNKRDKENHDSTLSRKERGERAKSLPRYQKEMKLFAQFLRRINS